MSSPPSSPPKGPSIPRKKVAILGGGPAGLAAALELTATPELRAAYEVTIYQAGWRLGGKCGQGRKGPANRIEINGTHYLFGAYREIFDVARTVFDELETAGDKRFGTFDEQFLPCSTVAVKEFFNGNWTTWVINLPGDGKPPEGDASQLTLGDSLRQLMGWVLEGCTGPDVNAAISAGHSTAAASNEPPPKQHWWQRVAHFFEREVHQAEHLAGLEALRLARRIVEGVEHKFETPAVRDALIDLLKHFRQWARDLLGGMARTHLEVHRAALLTDLGTTLMIGMLEDELFEPGGFDALDQYDLREYLLMRGALATTAWSAPITTWYNAIAAYANGNIETPNMSAGMGLRGLLRLGMTYRGAFSFQLSAEVGDSLIAPLYQVLINRGVKVLYFHRVRDVIPSDDGTTIAAIDVEQQVTLKSGDPASYAPFITLPNGRPVWPDEAIASQIADPLPTVDTNSFYSPRIGPVRTLTRGTDFDVAIYAMPIATVRWYASRIVAQRAEWQAMMDNLGTTETQSLRLWLYPTVEQMGWTQGQAVLSGYYQPLATWEDARQLIATETWPPNRTPGAIATLFGAFAGAPAVYPGPDDVDYPARRTDAAIANAQEFCQNLIGPLWPNAARIEYPVGLDLSRLVTLNAQLSGAARLLAQSIRGNVGPVEAYTQIHKGTLQFRLRADQTGYPNLFLAGDWIRNGFEVGSVEGAVLGGQQAAAAVMRA